MGRRRNGQRNGQEREGDRRKRKCGVERLKKSETYSQFDKIKKSTFIKYNQMIKGFCYVPCQYNIDSV